MSVRARLTPHGEIGEHKTNKKSPPGITAMQLTPTTRTGLLFGLQSRRVQGILGRSRSASHLHDSSPGQASDRIEEFPNWLAPLVREVQSSPGARTTTHRLTFLPPSRQSSRGTPIGGSASTAPPAKRVTALPGGGPSRLRTARQQQSVADEPTRLLHNGYNRGIPCDRLYVQDPYVLAADPPCSAAVSMQPSQPRRLA